MDLIKNDQCWCSWSPPFEQTTHLFRHLGQDPLLPMKTTCGVEPWLSLGGVTALFFVWPQNCDFIPNVGSWFVWWASSVSIFFWNNSGPGKMMRWAAFLGGHFFSLFFFNCFKLLFNLFQFFMFVVVFLCCVQMLSEEMVISTVSVFSCAILILNNVFVVVVLYCVQFFFGSKNFPNHSLLSLSFPLLITVLCFTFLVPFFWNSQNV